MQGATWTRVRVAGIGGYGPDPAGTTFNAYIHPDSDVLFVRSTDAGATWSSSNA
ncbi:MAG: hypothetical protein ACRD1K_00950 [Acidimicrobiales bacterium]